MKTSHKTSVEFCMHAKWLSYTLYSDIVWLHNINVCLDRMENNLQKQKDLQYY